MISFASPGFHMTAYFRPHHTDFASSCTLEARLIRDIRLWADGAEGRIGMAADLNDTLGPARASRVMQLWSELFDIFDRFGHHALDIKPPQSPQPSTDETALARLMILAANGQREDAMFAALMMVRADLSPIVTSLATQVGLSVRQSLLRGAANTHHATHHSVAQLH